IRDWSVTGVQTCALPICFHRANPEEGLTNRANLGYVPVDLILLKSHDGGESWDGPVTIRTPLVGPSFEICHRVIELADGRWLAPIGRASCRERELHLAAG